MDYHEFRRKLRRERFSWHVRPVAVCLVVGLVLAAIGLGIWFLRAPLLKTAGSAAMTAGQVDEAIRLQSRAERIEFEARLRDHFQDEVIRMEFPNEYFGAVADIYMELVPTGFSVSITHSKETFSTLVPKSLVPQFSQRSLDARRDELVEQSRGFANPRPAYRAEGSADRLH